VHLRTSSEIIVETARAAASGEALLPVGLAQSLAVKAQATEMPAGLDATELDLVSALACNHSIARMAHSLGYSDRTIRRRLQTLYVKLGVATRGEAIVRSQLLADGRSDEFAAS
jgi:DNA-binding NarL/FixJ family response regulator